VKPPQPVSGSGANSFHMEVDYNRSKAADAAHAKPENLAFVLLSRGIFSNSGLKLISFA
jgi:hypothetical protein